MGMKRYFRPSAKVQKSKRWKALRLVAIRRDGWRCVKCGRYGRMEVDHIESVRTAPEKAFDLANLQTLCPSCHGKKTRLELGFDPISPEREKWRKALTDIDS